MSKSANANLDFYTKKAKGYIQTSERHHRRHKQSDTVLRIFLMKTYTLHVHAYLTMYQNLITHLSLSLYIYITTPRLQETYNLVLDFINFSVKNKTNNN